MSGGPFRDALTPLLAEARRDLPALQAQRRALERRLADVRRAQREIPSGIKRFAVWSVTGWLLGLAVVFFLLTLR
jgi:hypothetical protein